MTKDQGAKSPSPRAASKRGQLRDQPLVLSLIRALDDAMTGCIWLQDPSGCEHVLRLVQGLPAGVETRQDVAPLGVILRRLGLSDELTREVRLSSGTRQDNMVLRAMARRGRVPEEVAWEALRLQLLQRARVLVGLPGDTVFVVHPGRNLLPSHHPREPIETSEGDVLRLVSAGVHMQRLELPIVEVLEPMRGHRLRLRNDALVGQLDLNDAERDVVTALLRDPLTTDELVECRIAPATVVDTVAYLLVILRFVLLPGDDRPPVGTKRRPRSGVVKSGPE